MKFVAALVAIALALSGCTTVQMSKIDAAIQKTAPATCAAVQIAYDGYMASGHGSVRDHEVVQAAYDATVDICKDPSTATSTQLTIVAVRLGIIAASLKKAKANG